MELIRYIRDKRGRLLGCVVFLDSRIGYSLCHPQDRHKLGKKMSRMIAQERAVKAPVVRQNGVWVRERIDSRYRRIHPVPQVVQKILDEMPVTEAPRG